MRIPESRGGIWSYISFSVAKVVNLHINWHWNQIWVSREEEVWTRWSPLVHKEILNTSLAEANYKLLSRWDLVRARLAKIYPGASPKCFRGQVGDMFHVWWLCSKVQRFWIRVFNLIYSVTGQIIPKNPKTALFADHSDEIPGTFKLLSFSYLQLLKSL